MASYSSATTREQASHVIANKLNPNNDDVRQRAWSLIRDKSLDEGSRTLMGYALEIDDPGLAELVQRAEAGQSVMNNIVAADTADNESTEQKVGVLAEMICLAHDPGTRAAALLVLMSALEEADDPKSLARNAKHYAFTRCGEMNVYGMVDAQTAMLQRELLAHNSR